MQAPPRVVAPKQAPVKVGIALGGGAAKGFAHIGVIKMLEANGIVPVVVSGTSAGSVVGALYASGMDAYAMQEKAFALDESKIRDVSLFSGGVVKGQKLQDYVNELVGGRTLEKMRKPLAVVATRLPALSGMESSAPARSRPRWALQGSFSHTPRSSDSIRSAGFSGAVTPCREPGT